MYFLSVCENTHFKDIRKIYTFFSFFFWQLPLPTLYSARAVGPGYPLLLLAQQHSLRSCGVAVTIPVAEAAISAISQSVARELGIYSNVQKKHTEQITGTFLYFY